MSELYYMMQSPILLANINNLWIHTFKINIKQNFEVVQNCNWRKFSKFCKFNVFLYRTYLYNFGWNENIVSFLLVISILFSKVVFIYIY